MVINLSSVYAGKCATAGKAAPLPSPYNEYRITRNGEVINKHGRILSQYNHSGTAATTIRANGKRVIICIAQAVYKAFIGEPNGRYIFHKDGNVFNNSVDNLAVISSEISAEQLTEYERWGIYSAKWYVGYKKLNEIQGFDVDNFIGEACLIMYRYLSLYDPSKYKFITWAIKYMAIAFKAEYKKYREVLRICFHKKE